MDLSEDILQLISVHLKADEWARGASQACRRLYRMHLPCISMHCKTREVCSHTKANAIAFFLHPSE